VGITCEGDIGPFEELNLRINNVNEIDQKGNWWHHIQLTEVPPPA
jgi:hypothetical protein